MPGRGKMPGGHDGDDQLAAGKRVRDPLRLRCGVAGDRQPPRFSSRRDERVIRTASAAPVAVLNYLFHRCTFRFQRDIQKLYTFFIHRILLMSSSARTLTASPLSWVSCMCFTGRKTMLLQDALGKYIAIPDHVVAAGNPCRVIRPITDADRSVYRKSDR